MNTLNRNEDKQEMKKKKLNSFMLAGTGSDVGKSVLAAAFCRILKQDGYTPAPFKAQNMALNSYVTPDGLEIGRAQAVQAEAAGVPCHVDMNPLLLKPSTEQMAQVVLCGKPVGDGSAYDFFQKEGRKELRKVVNEAYDRLAAIYNPVVMEGAGSISEINLRTANHERVLVTTLTKKMAEDLTAYLTNAGIKVRYMHHDIDTIERMEIIRDLRLGTFDVLVGINLLREGLDLPEVSMVAILDADKEGFLRSETSLIQTIGRAARNAEGLVVLYADTVTPSMRAAITETERRRKKQDAYNKAHGIVPQTIRKSVRKVLEISHSAEEEKTTAHRKLTDAEREATIRRLEKEMKEASKMLEFEYAALLRDQIIELRGQK